MQNKPETKSRHHPARRESGHLSGEAAPASRHPLGETEKRVEDIMHYGVISCRTDTVLKEVVRIITDSDVHALIVVHENGMLAGIVSHMDMLRLYGENLLHYKAQDIMTSEVITISQEATVKEAIALMLEHNIRRVLVTEQTAEGERPVGVVSTTDVIRDMREQPWFW